MFNSLLNILLMSLVTFLFFLQYRLWFEAGGIRDMLKLKHTLTKQIAVNDNLKKHNDELIFQIARNQNSADATEARARVPGGAEIERLGRPRRAGREWHPVGRGRGHAARRLLVFEVGGGAVADRRRDDCRYSTIVLHGGCTARVIHGDDDHPH